MNPSMNGSLCARVFVGAALALGLGACSGSDGKNAKPCTIQQNAAGANVLVCPDGTSTILGGTPLDGGATACTVTSLGGVKKITCADGSETLLPVGDAGAVTACTVVSNGDGTADMTCPGGDGGTITVTVKDALVSYANLSADDKAALDLQITVRSVTVPPTANPSSPSGCVTAMATRWRESPPRIYGSLC